MEDPVLIIEGGSVNIALNLNVYTKGHEPLCYTYRKMNFYRVFLDIHGAYTLGVIEQKTIKTMAETIFCLLSARASCFIDGAFQRFTACVSTLSYKVFCACSNVFYHLLPCVPVYYYHEFRNTLCIQSAFLFT